MNPQANPYQSQPPVPMQGGFAMPPVGAGQYPMPPVPGVAPYGQPTMQQNPAGLPPVPMQGGMYQQAPIGLPNTHSAAPGMAQQQVPALAQSAPSAAPTVSQTPTQAAILATKQAIARYANNPYEMIQAVQSVRSTYLAQQYNITDKIAE